MKKTMFMISVIFGLLFLFGFQVKPEYKAGEFIPPTHDNALQSPDSTAVESMPPEAGTGGDMKSELLTEYQFEF